MFSIRLIANVQLAFAGFDYLVSWPVHSNILTRSSFASSLGDPASIS